MNNIRNNAKQLIALKPDTAKIAHALRAHALTRIVRELELVEQDKKDADYAEAAVKNLIDVCKYPDDLSAYEYLEAVDEAVYLWGLG